MERLPRGVVPTPPGGSWRRVDGHMRWVPDTIGHAIDTVGAEDRAIAKALDAVTGALLVDDAARKALSTAPTSFRMQPSAGGGWSNLGGPGVPGGGPIPSMGGQGGALLSRVADNLAANFGRAPEEVEAALAQQGMTWGPPLSPGRPLNPYYGYRKPARTWDYKPGANVQIAPRWGRISFKTIRALWENYDIAQIATNHLINDVVSLDYHFEAAQAVRDDVSDEIAQVREFMDTPDKEQPFRSWLYKFLVNVVVLDCGCLYIRRNEGGDAIALEVVDGATITKLVDFFGRTPSDENDADPRLTAAGVFEGEVVPAYTQVIEGMVWDWFAKEDIIYQAWHPQPNSQYGRSALEAVLMTANTDLRFQWHFLNYFTQGNIPTGFMEAPEDMSDPTQIAEWQQYWDAMMLGDQAKLRQIRFVPAGSKYQPVGAAAEKFDQTFPLYLMRRVCAAFGVTPADLGFTEATNKATADTQVDVQFRVGTLPLVRFVEDVINLFISQHLKLRVRIRFDTGREIEDRLATAQAEAIYVKAGVLSADEPRTRLGYPINLKRPTPRFIDNTRNGPVPLLALESLAGETDPETYGPAKDTPLIDHPFVPAPGVMPPIGSVDAKNADNTTAAMQSNMIAAASGKKPPYPDDETTSPPPKSPPKGASKSVEERLDALLLLLKAHSVEAAGIAVVARDSGRVLMIQRDNDDPSKKASGRWEMPGGRCVGSEDAWDTAVREWQEETGNRLPTGKRIHEWDDGNYRLFVYAIKTEADINLNPDRVAMEVVDPDHPNARQTEVMAWWAPKDAKSAGKAIRKELRDFDWDLLDLGGAAKDAGAPSGGLTSGITATSGMTGVDLRDDDDDDDDDVEKSEVIAVQLRQWRENAKNRLRKGLAPRRFVSADLPSDLADAVWQKLETATTREEIEAAFTSAQPVAAHT